MEYIMMTVEEAQKCAKKDAVVLVSKADLENNGCNVGFEKKKFGECKNILEEAATIAKVCDDFANQLRVFSEHQVDVIAFEPHGIMNTILLPPVL